MHANITLDAGSGGRASQRLIANAFLRHFDNDILARMDDGAILPSAREKLAMSTDSYTVSPLFFPGASIGSLAINGTVNDVAMCGAKPLFLSCAFILEEGLPLSVLEKVVADMSVCAKAADIKIVTGDTKVVPAGACDKIFINTTGIGEIYADPLPSGHNARPGDLVLINGSLGDHGLAVMAAREEISFFSNVRSDCAPLNKLVEELVLRTKSVHVLRDPTRGGLATTLNEIAEQSQVGIQLDESAIPVHPEVADGCSFMGLDPLYLANEGKCICILPEEKAEQALGILKRHNEEAAVIGRVTAENPGKVVLNTLIGGQRFLGMLEGAQLPRIC